MQKEIWRTRRNRPLSLVAKGRRFDQEMPRSIMKKVSFFIRALWVLGILLTASACAGASGADEETTDATYGAAYTPQEHQQRTFNALWEHFTENYIYADTSDVDWDALYEEYSGRIGEGLTNEQFTE